MSRLRNGFTTRASCLIAAGVTAMLCGVLLGERDLLRAGVLATAVPLAAGLVVRRAQLRIANRRRVEPMRADAGEPVTVHLTITNRSALPTGSLMLEDRLPDRVSGRARFVLDSLRAHEARTVSYRIPGLGRGHYRVGPLRIRLTDPFHMIDITRSFTTTADFVVAPIVDPLGASEPPRSYDVGENAGSHSVGMHGADDASTREYRTGDDLRKIHWRSTARTGSLMVRLEERPWQGAGTVILDLRAGAHVRTDPGGHADDRATDSLEWAVSAAASVGAHLIGAGRDISIATDPGSAERLRFAEVPRLVDHLAGVSEVRRPDLAGFGGLLRTATRDSVVVAILGRLDGKSLEVLADAHPRGWSAPAFAMLLDVDTWSAASVAAASPAEPTPLTAPTSAPMPAQPSATSSARPGTPTSCEAAAAVLRSSGWRVVIVRRGDSLPTVWRTLLGRGVAPRAVTPAVIR